MKRIIVALLLAGAFFGSVGTAQAMELPDEPFISVTVAPEVLNLGTLMAIPSAHGLVSSPASLMVKVNSNCMHGPILVTMTDLRHYKGNIIKSDKIFVQSPATGGFVPMARPVMISEPTTGSHDIELDFKVDSSLENIAGRYEGTLVFTVIPPI